ncbi:MAG: NADH-quinone oxidoreductase subunit NuoI [Thermodesulfobacteriota bacterium]|jgi:NADH-quinone oxidoreductase chain I|nr:MAG: NADH-quinone oxidoreductase subunit NuoI [Thermodesulfobacteriota bacterium]
MIEKTIKGIWALLIGLSVTVKFFFTRPVTMKYPEEKREPYLRYRGSHILRLDEKGKEKCVACCLCATVCPAQVITIEAGEGNEHEKYPVTFEIDMGKCIFCGYCVEACPKAAIIMSQSYELAEYRREDLSYDKERLIKTGK